MYHSDFVHLHLHSEFSLLDGACHLGDIVSKAAEFRMPAVAVTDHGNMFAAIQFYSKAMEAGVKPILGSEVYVAPRSRFDKGETNGLPPAFHLVLLCKDELGYKNLIQLTTKAVFEGFYRYPRIDKDLLREYGEGLIGLSACLKGEIAYWILKDRRDLAEKALREYLEIFGRENFYLEVQENAIPEQEKANRGLVDLAKKYDLGLVATNDVHYILPEHARAHEILLCIQTQTNIHDPKRMRMSSNLFYFASPEEMKRRFKDLPSAVLNTREIADRCNVILEFGKNHMPLFHPPEGKTSREYLWELCMQGLERRYHDPGRRAEVMERLKFEFSIIERMGYVNYFLIVWDFVRYAKENRIPVGPGRGSAAGSMVSYLLGITNIDPLKYGLLFERFLNPERVSMPDIDIDFCYENRQKVIDYVVEKYGRSSVAQIITFGTMQARAVVRDVARAMALPYSLADKIAKMIPQSMSLKEALEVEPDLRRVYDESPQIKELIDVAMALEGLTRHASTHAAGVVIADKPLTEYVPLYKNRGQICTAYEMKSLEKIGLLKMDFLGLKTLTVIEKTLNFIEERTGRRLDIDEIPLDDEKTFQLLREARTKGIFQLESAGMRDLLVRMQPDKFEDIIALLALYRPGPIGSGMLDDFIRRKRGETEISYLHPKLEPILRETYGVILYQEQVMQIASSLAGFSLAQADILRRAMGKKIPEVMEEQRTAFISGCVNNGVSRDVAERIFDLIEFFSGYGFNKSHSAAYALVSYRTAYLKANYPLEFMASLLTSEFNNTDKMVEYLKDARQMGIEILPPDVNHSVYEFSVEGDKIRFGLGAIKNVGAGAIEDIVSERKRSGAYKDFYDFCSRVAGKRVNKKVIESLIKAGALDLLGMSRKQMFESLDDALAQASARKRDELLGQLVLFEAQPHSSGPQGFDLPGEEWSEHELLAHERETLGFYLSGHPLSNYEGLISRLKVTPIAELGERKDSSQVTIAGVLNKVQVRLVKDKSDKFAVLSLEDLSGEVEAMCFPSVFRKYQSLIEEGKVLIALGRADVSENGVKFVVDQLWDIGSIAEVIKEVKIDVSGMDKRDLVVLRERLGLYRGQVPLLVMVKGRRDYALVYTDQDLFVSPTPAFIEEIEDIVGRENVYLVL